MHVGLFSQEFDRAVITIVVDHEETVDAEPTVMIEQRPKTVELVSKDDTRHY